MDGMTARQLNKSAITPIYADVLKTNLTASQKILLSKFLQSQIYLKEEIIKYTYRELKQFLDVADGTISEALKTFEKLGYITRPKNDILLKHGNLLKNEIIFINPPINKDGVIKFDNMFNFLLKDKVNFTQDKANEKKLSKNAAILAARIINHYLDKKNKRNFYECDKKHVASFLHVSMPTANRIIKELETTGIIERFYGNRKIDKNGMRIGIDIHLKKGVSHRKNQANVCLVPETILNKYKHLIYDLKKNKKEIAQMNNVFSSNTSNDETLAVMIEEEKQEQVKKESKIQENKKLCEEIYFLKDKDIDIRNTINEYTSSKKLEKDALNRQDWTTARKLEREAKRAYSKLICYIHNKGYTRIPKNFHRFLNQFNK